MIHGYWILSLLFFAALALLVHLLGKPQTTVAIMTTPLPQEPETPPTASIPAKKYFRQVRTRELVVTYMDGTEERYLGQITRVLPRQSPGNYGFYRESPNIIEYIGDGLVAKLRTSAGLLFVPLCNPGTKKVAVGKEQETSVEITPDEYWASYCMGSE